MTILDYETNIYNNLVKAGFSVVDTNPDTFTSPVVIIGGDTEAWHPTKPNEYALTDHQLYIDYYMQLSKGRIQFEKDIMAIRNAIGEPNVIVKRLVDRTFQNPLLHASLTVNVTLGG